MSEIICRSISNGREFEVPNDYFRSLHALRSECNSYTLAEERYTELLAGHDKQIRTEVIEEVFGKIEERLNDSTTITFDLPVEEVLGEDVDIDDFIMLAEEIVQEYKNLIFSKLKQAKKQLKEQMQKGAENE